MKVNEILREAADEIWEVQLTYSDSEGASPAADDSSANRFASDHKCLAVCVDRNGPSGGWPEYVFYGPKPQLERLVHAYADEGDPDDFEMYWESAKRSNRKFEFISAADIDAKRDSIIADYFSKVIRDWDAMMGGTSAATTHKQDLADLKRIHDLFVAGKFKKALEHAEKCDTIIREVIPAIVWDVMGGDLLPAGKRALEKQRQKLGL